jgi:hypothetical protein
VPGRGCTAGAADFIWSGWAGAADFLCEFRNAADGSAVVRQRELMIRASLGATAGNSLSEDSHANEFPPGVTHARDAASAFMQLHPSE